MPVHDWIRAPAGYFHHFQQTWSGNICDALNGGLLPRGIFALVERRDATRTVRNVLTLEDPAQAREPVEIRGGLTLADAPPRARFVQRAEAEDYAARANRVVVRQSRGEVVSVIEIVSPGNKSSAYALDAFASKSVEFLRLGIHLLVIDLFPPTPRDPQGIHKAIWDQITHEPFELPADKPLTLAVYAAGAMMTAYVEPVAVGDALADMPAFLAADRYVPVPLEATYAATWAGCPMEFKEAVQ